MDPITIGLALASQFAPALIKYFTNSDTAGAVAGQVIEVAKTVTGKGTPDEATAALQADPALALQFKMAVMANETDLQKAYLADAQSARDRDVKLAQTGQRNHRADVMFLLAVVVTCGLVWIIWRDPGINEYVKGIFTLVLGRFLGYLDNIYNFEFGTTRSNKMKDDTINNLTK